MIQVGLATARTVGRTWCCLHGAGFTDKQSASIGGGSEKFLPRFQKKACKVRMCAPDRAVCKVVDSEPESTMETSESWRSQELRN